MAQYFDLCIQTRQPLAGGIAYNVTVAAGLQDVAGASLPADYVWRFSTIPPAVTWVSPYEDATLVGIDVPIVVEFNQPIAPDSARNAFSLTADGLLSSRVRGELQVQGSTLVFTPTAALSFDTVTRSTSTRA